MSGPALAYIVSDVLRGVPGLYARTAVCSVYARLRIQYHQNTWRFSHEGVWRHLQVPRSGYPQGGFARAARLALRCSPRPRVMAICAPRGCRQTYLACQAGSRPEVWEGAEGVIGPRRRCISDYRKRTKTCDVLKLVAI
ncbi:Glyceraldehyde-3-phosphate dehydrogenase [Alternaria alternata]|nr:Glyceraldehyde-3-phosphate dehydrogenase [Alternaria alternata]